MLQGLRLQPGSALLRVESSVLAWGPKQEGRSRACPRREIALRGGGGGAVRAPPRTHTGASRLPRWTVRTAVLTSSSSSAVAPKWPLWTGAHFAPGSLVAGSGAPDISAGSCNKLARLSGSTGLLVVCCMRSHPSPHPGACFPPFLLRGSSAWAGQFAAHHRKQLVALFPWGMRALRFNLSPGIPLLLRWACWVPAMEWVTCQPLALMITRRPVLAGCRAIAGWGKAKADKPRGV